MGWHDPTSILSNRSCPSYLGIWGLASARDSSRARCRASSSLCKERERETSFPGFYFVWIYFCLSNLTPTHQAILQSNNWRGCPGWKLGCGSTEDIKQAAVRDVKGLKWGEEKCVDLPAGGGCRRQGPTGPGDSACRSQTLCSGDSSKPEGKKAILTNLPGYTLDAKRVVCNFSDLKGSDRKTENCTE